MALLFYSLTLDAKSQDDASMYTGCPVLSGTKWSATKWCSCVCCRRCFTQTPPAWCHVESRRWSTCCRIHTDPFHPEWLTAGGETTPDSTSLQAATSMCNPATLCRRAVQWRSCTAASARMRSFSKTESVNAANESADQPLPRPEECTDEHGKCSDWAAAGECEHNRGYMVILATTCICDQLHARLLILGSNM